MVVRRWAAVGLFAGVVLAVAPPPAASAHTALKEASPAARSSVPSPSAIVLTYADPVSFPQVVVTDAGGGQHAQGKARAVDNKVTQPVTGTLAAGVYTVGWRVVSPDGHPISGEYTFTVTGGSATGSAQATSQPVQAQNTPAPSSEETSSAGWLWLGLIALLIAGAVGGAVLWRRRNTA